MLLEQTIVNDIHKYGEADMSPYHILQIRSLSSAPGCIEKRIQQDYRIQEPAEIGYSVCKAAVHTQHPYAVSQKIQTQYDIVCL